MTPLATDAVVLQQYLPFTVLKPSAVSASFITWSAALQQYLPFTVLKLIKLHIICNNFLKVATVLTVYGIETRRRKIRIRLHDLFQLQQYLPFTVLKLE